MGGCDHHSLATFSSKDDENYKFILSAIKKARKTAAHVPGPIPPAVPEGPSDVQGAQPGKALSLVSMNATSNSASISTRSY
jgi:hypothetical protein